MTTAPTTGRGSRLEGLRHGALRTRRRLVGRAIAPLLRSQQEHRRSQFAAVGVPPGRIVLLGDSITEFGLWDEWFPGLPMLNRGIGGETSAEVLRRLDTAIREPRAVFLLIGTNDLSIGVPEETVVENIRSILAGIEQRAAGCPVYLQSVMPRSVRLRDELLSLNRRLQDLTNAVAGSVTWVDLWPTLATPQGGLRPEFSLDRLHLGGDGYRAWTACIRPLVEAAARA